MKSLRTKQSTHHRIRRVGSAMGRVAYGGPLEDPFSVFTYAMQVASARRFVRDTSGAHAFADAFLVAWCRARDRKADAKALRRGLSISQLVSDPSVLRVTVPHSGEGGGQMVNTRAETVK